MTSSRKLRVAVAGSSGFIGQHIRAGLIAAGHRVVPLGREELGDFGFRGHADAVAEYVWTLSPENFDSLITAMAGADAVVNAAGSATPSAEWSNQLTNANIVLPLVLQRAAAELDVGRFVHLSSAAVQGSKSILDEGPPASPRTPYARSKAAAEEALQASAAADKTSTIIYRPTSVQGPGRATTQKLLRGLRYAAVVADGSAPLPITSAAAVGRAVAHLVESEGIRSGVVLHPWEGLTQAQLLRAVGRDPSLRLPYGLVKFGCSVGLRVPSAPVKARARRGEIFFLGQQVHAIRLTQDGFSLTPPATILEDAGVC